MSESNSTPGPPGFGPGAPALDTTSMAGSLIACAVLCWVICGVGVGARFYARGRIQNVLAREDWCVLAAWVRGPFLLLSHSLSLLSHHTHADQNAHKTPRQLLALGFTVGTIY